MLLRKLIVNLCAHHTLAEFGMTKLEVLVIFAENGDFIVPDEVRKRLRTPPARRSLYSYLKRLRLQGLLERHLRSRRGQLAYRITQRGRARLIWLRGHSG